MITKNELNILNLTDENKITVYPLLNLANNCPNIKKRYTENYHSEDVWKIVVITCNISSCAKNTLLNKLNVSNVFWWIYMRTLICHYIIKHELFIFLSFLCIFNNIFLHLSNDTQGYSHSSLNYSHFSLRASIMWLCPE